MENIFLFALFNGVTSSILSAKYIAEEPIIVIIQRITLSLKIKVYGPISKIESQSKPLIIIPESIVAIAQVEALKESASVLFSDVVNLMIKGNEQTLINITPIPQSRKPN